MEKLNLILLVWCLIGVTLCGGWAWYFWRFERKYPKVKFPDENPKIKTKYLAALMLCFGCIFALILGLILVLAYITEQVSLGIPAMLLICCLFFCWFMVRRKNF